MIAFPSIGKKVEKDLKIYAFDKLDGSNIQALWEWDRGFSMFGTRKRPINENTKTFGEAIQLINDGYSEAMREVFEANGVAQASCFFEFVGEHSFAGRHKTEKHHTILFDVYISNPPTGFVAPDMFIRFFAGKVPTSKLLYEGVADEAFLSQVKEGTLPGINFEGVVCKGTRRTNENKNKEIVVFKAKNKHWIQALSDQCKGDMELFNKLV